MLAADVLLYPAINQPAKPENIPQLWFEDLRAERSTKYPCDFDCATDLAREASSWCQDRVESSRDAGFAEASVCDTLALGSASAIAKRGGGMVASHFGRKFSGLSP